MLRIIIALMLSVTFAQAEVKIKTKSEGLVSGDRLKYESGKLKLYPEKNNGFSLKFKLTDIVFVDTAESSGLKFLRKYFLEGKGNLIANDKGEKVLAGNYMTGWGKQSAFLLAMAYIKQKKFEEAEKVLKKGAVQIPGVNDKEDKLLLKLAQSYLFFERGRPEFLMDDLKKISVPDTALGKMFYYQLQGMLLEKNARSAEAVLSYYKGIMFGVKSNTRKIIQTKIEGIYKSQNDSRKLPDLNKI